MLVPLLTIVGPTAVGKSALALHLAQVLNGEIISADSRQVYRLMDIGTAKPSLQDRSRVPHHLIDVVNPDQDFSLALFLDLARQAIQDVHSNGKLPIVVGGTGQYIWALIEGWQVPHVPPDPALRRRLESEEAAHLYQKLNDIDPDSASRIDGRNLRRIVRALEIYHKTGLAPSTVRGKRPPPYSPVIVGLTMGREALYVSIDRRVEEMLKTGLVEEVRGLLGMGYSPELPCMSSVGYKEVVLHLRGVSALEEAARRIAHGTHRLARRQNAWFRRGDPRIHWLEAGPDANHQAEALVDGLLRGVSSCGKIASANQEKEH